MKLAVGFALFIAASVAQAVPTVVINHQDITVSYRVELIEAGGTTVLTDSALGSIFGPTASVGYDERFNLTDFGGEEHAVTANATFEELSPNSFALDVEGDVYSLGFGGPFPEIQNANAEGRVDVFLNFDITGGNVDFSAGVFDEVFGPFFVLPPPTWDGSIATVSLYDETMGVNVVDLIGGWGFEADVTLLDGHNYTLMATAADFGPDDEDTIVEFQFLGDVRVKAPGPGTLALLALGLVGIAARRYKRV